MNTSATIIIVETIITIINNKILEPSEVTSNENEISKLNSVWNNYDRRLNRIEIINWILIPHWCQWNCLERNQVIWMVGFIIIWFKEKQIDLIE